MFQYIRLERLWWIGWIRFKIHFVENIYCSYPQAVLWIRIRIDPHHFSYLDPHTHQKKNPDLDPHPVPHQNLLAGSGTGSVSASICRRKLKCMEYEPILALFQGSASGWKVGFGSASNKESESGSAQGDRSNPDPYPGPYQRDADPQHCPQETAGVSTKKSKKWMVKKKL